MFKVCRKFRERSFEIVTASTAITFYLLSWVDYAHALGGYGVESEYEYESGSTYRADYQQMLIHVSCVEGEKTVAARHHMIPKSWIIACKRNLRALGENSGVSKEINELIDPDMPWNLVFGPLPESRADDPKSKRIDPFVSNPASYFYNAKCAQVARNLAPYIKRCMNQQFDHLTDFWQVLKTFENERNEIIDAFDSSGFGWSYSKLTRDWTVNTSSDCRYFPKPQMPSCWNPEN